jgi:hypothetical protein
MGRCLGLDEVDMVKVGQQPASFQHQTKGWGSSTTSFLDPF